MTITWYIVPEVSNTTDRILCHFGMSFALYPSYEPRKLNRWKNKNNAWRYYHFTHVHHKWQSHDVWFLRYGSHDVCCMRYWAQQTEFFVILDGFFALSPSYQTTKSKFWKKEKSTWKYYYFTHVYHKWQFDVWFLRCGARQTDILWFYTIFCHLSPLKTHKINIFKKWKKRREISSFNMHASKIMIILLHCSWGKTHDKYNFYFLFWAIFYPFTPLQKQEKSKLKKNR